MDQRGFETPTQETSASSAPSASISPRAQIGRDVRVGQFVVIKDGVEVGDGCVIGDHAVLGVSPTIAKGSTLTRMAREGLVAASDGAISQSQGQEERDPEQPDHEEGVVDPETRVSASTNPLRLGSDCAIGVGAVLYMDTTLADGCFVADHAQIRERCQLGRNVIVGRGATVENDCVIGDYTRIQTGAYITALSTIEDHVFIAPMVVTTNDNYLGRTEERFKHRKGVTVRRGARIGAGAVILPGVEIGQEAVVAAGAVVTRNVPPYSVVMGCPARPVRPVPEEQVLFHRLPFPETSGSDTEGVH